jgi:hypothetical protein
MLLENKNAIIILVVLLSYGAAAGSAGMGSTGPADAATEAFIRYLAALAVFSCSRPGSGRS